jgi:hypothetical protein
MKRTFVLLWCALVGCSIIPEDAFKTIPKATLQKITITSNVDGESEVLVGNVTTSGLTSTIDFDGTFDPFPYLATVDKIELEYTEDSLVSKIVTHFEGGSSNTEELTYNGEYLWKSVLTSENYVRTLDFYWTGGDAKKLQKIERTYVTGGNTYYGEIRRFGNAYDYNVDRLVDVYPYDETQAFPEAAGILQCNDPFETAPYGYHLDATAIDISIADPYKSMSYGLFINKNGNYITDSNSLNYQLERNALIPIQHSFVATSKPEKYGSACSSQHPGLSVYRLIPQISLNYVLLHVANISTERHAVTAEPQRLSSFSSFKVEYEYNFSE